MPTCPSSLGRVSAGRFAGRSIPLPPRTTPPRRRLRVRRYDNARSLFITRILFPASYPFPISADLAKQAGRASKASLRAINYHRASDDQCSTGDRPCVFPRSFPGFKVRRMSPGCSSNRLPDEKCVCLFAVLAFFRTTTVAEYKSCLGMDFSADSSLVANISWVTSNFTVLLSFFFSILSLTVARHGCDKNVRSLNRVLPLKHRGRVLTNAGTPLYGQTSPVPLSRRRRRRCYHHRRRRRRSLLSPRTHRAT